MSLLLALQGGTPARYGVITFAEIEVPDAPRHGVITFAEIEVPDAPTTERRGIVTWAELEVPHRPDGGLTASIDWRRPPSQMRAGRVYGVELEVPTAPRRGIISFAEIEVPDNDAELLQLLEDLIVWGVL